MIILFSLVGFYVLLYIPFLGHGIEHLFLHLFIHWLQHHEDAVAVVAPAALWLLLFSLPLLLVFGFWFLAGDVFVVILILLKLFGTLGH